MEQFELTTEQWIVGALGAGRIECREGVGVSQEFASGDVRRDSTGIGGLRDVGAGLPPRFGQLDVEGAQACDEIVDEGGGIRHGGGA